MEVQVKVKIITEIGKYSLDEIKGLKEGTLVKGNYNKHTNSVLFDWNGNDAILFIDENCILTKNSKEEIKKTNALNRIFVDDEIKKEENEYLNGKYKNKLIKFIYYNTKNDKEVPLTWTYKNALSLAYNRAYDGRYKNFEFIIKK